MKMYRLMLKSDYVSTSHFPFQTDHELGLDSSLVSQIVGYKDQSRLPDTYTFYYHGTIRGNVVVVTPGVFLCVSRLKQEFEKHTGFSFSKTILIDIDFSTEVKGYYLFRPNRIIHGLINDKISNWSYFGKDRSYQFKSYKKIGLIKSSVDQLEEEVFKISEAPLFVYIKESLLSTFANLPMFAIEEVQIA